jgi:hypothetical protein
VVERHAHISVPGYVTVVFFIVVVNALVPGATVA